MLVPLGRDLLAAQRPRRLHVLLERVEVADRRRPKHGRTQHDVGQRVLRVLAGLAAAGEERLERLRRELDHAVALDPAWPSPLEVELLRAEHAELHGAQPTAGVSEDLGSVSEHRGLSDTSRSRLRVDDDLRDPGQVAADPLLDLARARVRLGERERESSPIVRKTTSPSSVSRNRSSRGGAAGRLLNDARHRLRVGGRAPRRRPSASSASGSRCVRTRRPREAPPGSRARPRSRSGAPPPATSRPAASGAARPPSGRRPAAR